MDERLLRLKIKRRQGDAKIGIALEQRMNGTGRELGMVGLGVMGHNLC